MKPHWRIQNVIIPITGPQKSPVFFPWMRHASRQPGTVSRLSRVTKAGESGNSPARVWGLMNAWIPRGQCSFACISSRISIVFKQSNQTMAGWPGHTEHISLTTVSKAWWIRMHPRVKSWILNEVWTLWTDRMVVPVGLAAHCSLNLAYLSDQHQPFTSKAQAEFFKARTTMPGSRLLSRVTAMLNLPPWTGEGGTGMVSENAGDFYSLQTMCIAPGSS